MESAALSTAILEEDLNLDLNAAIQSYQSLITHFDAQRAMAANAIFRLAECYRRLGRAEEARSQYARILREFADQAPLVRLCGRYVASLTATPPNQLSEGLLAYYPLTDDGKDQSGHGLDLKLNNVLFSTVGSGAWDMRRAASFDGQSSYAIVDQALIVALTNWTWSGWLYSPQPQAENPPEHSIYMEGLQAGNCFTIEIIPDEMLQTAAWNVGFPNNWMRAPVPYVLTNGWNHLALTLADGGVGSGTLSIFFNGVFTNSAVLQRVNPGDASPRVGVLGNGWNAGSGYLTAPWKGSMADLRFYNRALSAAEIQAIYAAGSAGKGVVTVAPSTGTATLEWQLAQARNELIKAKGQVAKAQALLAAAKAKLQENHISPEARSSVAQGEAELDLGQAQESLWSQEVARLEARLKEQEQRGRGHEAVARLKYQQAQAEFKRVQALFHDNVVSQTDYDAARLALEKAAADYPGAAESGNKLPGRVYVSGQVKVQGPVDFDVGDNLTAFKAILRAGGFGDFANKKKVRVVRGGSGAGAGQQTIQLDMTEIERGNIERDIPLQPGDYIIVPSRAIPQ